MYSSLTVVSVCAGIGVPILLAYVYGVVPISLCRSGGCGVTTTNAGGVRFEFDDEAEAVTGVQGPYPGGTVCVPAQPWLCRGMAEAEGGL